MANCPKCNRHLRIIDWKQSCPHCGANVVLYDLQERLMKDADKAEVQNYYFQKRMDRLKASFVGTKLAIVRIFTCLLPVAALFLPLVDAKVGTPLVPYEGKISAITLYGMMEKLNLNAFGDLLGDAASKPAALALLVAVGALLLSLVMLLLHFILLIFACSPHAKQRGILLNGLLLLLTLTSMIAFAAMPQNTFLNGSLSIGAFVYLGLMLLCSGVDLFLLFRGIPIHHKPCFVGGIPIEEYLKMVEDGVPAEELRQEMYRRLNALQEEKNDSLRAQTEKNETGLSSDGKEKAVGAKDEAALPADAEAASADSPKEEASVTNE